MVVELTKKAFNAKGYDFLDFGASKGASIEFAKNHLFGHKGLGIDIDPKRVKIMKKAGYDCIVGDLTNLKVPDKSVRFVKMAHILEHMEDVKNVQKVVSSAKKAATDFLVITGPFFDADEYLKSQGFKLHWSDYPDHPCHLTTTQLTTILKKLNLNDYDLYLRYPISDSANPHIHPLNSPSWSHQYDPNVHPPKKLVTFSKNVWTDFVCYVRFKELDNWDKITKAYKNQIPYIEHRGQTKYVWPAKAITRFNIIDRELQISDKRASELNAKSKLLNNKVSGLKKQISAIKASKSWAVIRLVQRTYIVARQPKLALKKVRTKLKV